LTKPILVTLHKNSLQDIPATMRVVADEVESNKHGEITKAVVVIENTDGECEFFCIGDVDIFGAVFLANRVQQKVMGGYPQ